MAADIKLATTLSYAATILQAVSAILVFLLILFIGGFAALAPNGGPAGLLIGVIGLFALILVAVWVYIDYFLVYKPLKAGKYAQIANTMLIIGIVEFFFGGSIPGLLMIIAWAVARG